jgi:hypothetical protein
MLLRFLVRLMAIVIGCGTGGGVVEAIPYRYDESVHATTDAHAGLSKPCLIPQLEDHRTPVANQAANVPGASTTPSHSLNATNNLFIDDGQFGTKVGKHASDFGFDPKDPAAREQIRSIIEGIHANATDIRQGAYNPAGGGGSDYCFYLLGNDVVLTKADGTFVTILKGGIANRWFQNAGGD